LGFDEHFDGTKIFCKTLPIVVESIIFVSPKKSSEKIVGIHSLFLSWAGVKS